MLTVKLFKLQEARSLNISKSVQKKMGCSFWQWASHSNGWFLLGKIPSFEMDGDGGIPIQLSVLDAPDFAVPKQSRSRR